MVEVTGNTITVTMAANGLLPDNPHAAHIHFGAEARHECPVLSDDKNGDGHLNTTEGGPAYGDIVVSLTKTGDTSPKSGLAIDRFSTRARRQDRLPARQHQGLERRRQGDLGRPVRRRHPRCRLQQGRQVLRSTKSDLMPSLPDRGHRPGPVRRAAVAPAGGMHTGGGQAARRPQERWPERGPHARRCWRPARRGRDRRLRRPSRPVARLSDQTDVAHLSDRVRAADIEHDRH